MNTLFSTGQVVTVAVGQTYTLKDNEVMINGVLYRKIDLEIAMHDNDGSKPQEKVKVGVRLREGIGGRLPAEMFPFDKWTIDSTPQTSLSQLVENLNTAIK